MKRLLVIFAAMLLSASAFAQNGKSIYNKYSDAKGVEAVYISPAMFKMMGRLPAVDFEGNGLNLTSIVRSLSGMYVIESENPGINSGIRDDVEKFVKRGDYEILMEAKEDGEVVRIYTLGDETTVTSFVLLSYEEDECAFVCLEGQISREELERIIELDR